MARSAERGSSTSKDPTGLTTMFTFISIVTLIVTTLINAYGVRLLSLLNNIGVGDRDPGDARVRPHPPVLRQRPVAVDPDRHGRHGAATGGKYLPAFALGMFMALFVVYGFDTAGTFGEETLDASRQAPRGVLWSVAGLGHRRHRLPARGHPGHPGHAGRDAEGQAGFPIATRSHATLTYEIAAGITVGEIYCSSSSRRSSSAPWPSRARRRG